MDWSKVTEWIKLTPRYLVPIFLAASCLLFAPAAFLTQLGLDQLIAEYRGWVGGIWITSGALLLSHAFISAASPLRRWYRNWSRVRRLKKQIPRLSPQEIAVLARYIDEQKSTLVLPMSHGVAGSLEAKKLIFRSANISTGLDRFAYTIQPWAWEYLNEKPELLEPGRHFQPEENRGFW